MDLCKLIYRLRGVKFGGEFKTKGFPIIVNVKGSEISFGDKVSINSSLLSNLIGLYQRTIIVTRTPEAKIAIGDNVGMSGVTIYARESIKIGNNTRIGANTKIMDNDFHPVDPEMRLKSSNTNMAVKPVEIGENVFIGCNALILKGTTIGDNTTIGAGSVVSGQIPANCVAAGNPAKVIKMLNSEETPND